MGVLALPSPPVASPIDDPNNKGNFADLEIGVAKAGTREEDAAEGTNPLTSGEMTRIVSRSNDNIEIDVIKSRCLFLFLLLIILLSIIGAFLDLFVLVLRMMNLQTAQNCVFNVNQTSFDS